jgi:hypothetical protein
MGRGRDGLGLRLPTLADEVILMWLAYFQANGELRYEILRTTNEVLARAAADAFVKRMSHPSVGLWWVWVEFQEIIKCHTV